MRNSSGGITKGISLLSKLSSWTSILKIAGSIVLIGGVATWSLFQKEDEAERYVQPPTSQTIFQKEIEIGMDQERGKKTYENANLQVDLDENNTLHLGIYTQNYNNPRWGRKEVALKQFTTINDRWSKVYLIHPKQVKVSDKGQIAYTVPKHKWIRLIPSDEDPVTRIVSEQGKTLICETTGLLIPVPFAGEVLGNFIDNSTNSEEKTKNKTLEQLVQDGYIITKIPPQTTKNISSNITAKEYTIEFDTSSFRESAKIPAYLWIRTALGDSSAAASGSVPNRYGLEEKLIEFDLTAKKAEIPEEIIARKETILPKEEIVADGRGKYEPLVGVWVRELKNIKNEREYLFLSPEGWGGRFYYLPKEECPQFSNGNSELFFNYSIEIKNNSKRIIFQNNVNYNKNKEISGWEESEDNKSLRMWEINERIKKITDYKTFFKKPIDKQLVGTWDLKEMDGKIPESIEYIFWEEGTGKIRENKKDKYYFFYSNQNISDSEGRMFLCGYSIDIKLCTKSNLYFKVKDNNTMLISDNNMAGIAIFPKDAILTRK